MFSQWTQILDLVSAACTQNALPTIKLYGNARKKQQANLSRFKTDPDSTVLLLPTSSGANGLNLTEATNVIVVEPLLNPAIELQALGRVHRIGQKATTFVWNLLIEDSVEENVLQQKTHLRKLQSPDAPNSPRKKAAEKARKGGKLNETGTLTLSELQLLFQSNASRRPAGAGAGAGAGAAAGVGQPDEALAINAAYWSGLVLRRGQEVSREDAERNIAVARSFGRVGVSREDQTIGSFSLFGKNVNPEIAAELLELKEATQETKFAEETKLHRLALAELLAA